MDLLEIPDATGAESEIEVDIFFNRWRLFDSETALINFASMSILEMLFIDETLLVCLIPSEIEPNISSVDDGTKFENFLTAEAVSAILEVTRVVDATLENVPAIALKSSFFNNEAVPDTLLRPDKALNAPENLSVDFAAVLTTPNVLEIADIVSYLSLIHI